MSEKFTDDTMIAGNVYRLVAGADKNYHGKLFIATTTDVGAGGTLGVNQAACLEDGFSLFGLLAGAEFVEANAKVVEFDAPKEQEELPF